MTTSVAVKPPCIAATSAPITLSGEQTVGGFPAVDGDRILVKDQTDPVDNGIYIVSTGDWTRAPDFDGARDAVFGTLVVVVSESSSSGILYRVTTEDDPIVFGTSEITFEPQSNSSLILNLTELGVVGGNVGDQGPAVNVGISSLSAAGGGGIYCPPGDYRHTTSIVLRDDVNLWAQGGATFVWAGLTTLPQITMPSTSYTINAGMNGVNLNAGSAAKAIEVRSGLRCTFRDMTIAANTTSSSAYLIDLLCNSSGTLNEDGNLNCVFNYFENIVQTGTCGTFVRLRGNGVVGSGEPFDQVVTLCVFVSVQGLRCTVRGIDFNRWCDSNDFVGMTRVSMQANNSTGVEYNSDAPTSNRGVYANTFQHLAVDTFAGFTGRVGLKLNETKYVYIGLYFQDPVAEGGSYVILANCHSYDFTLAQDPDDGDGRTNALRRVTNASIKTAGDGLLEDNLDIGTGVGSIRDLRLFSGGFMQARIRHDIAAANWLDFFGSTAGTSPVIQAEGADTNIGLTIYSKGASSVAIGTNHGVGGINIGLVVTHTASGVNFVEVQQNTTGNAPVVRAGGTDTNINLALQSKGTGSVLLGTNSTTNQVVITHTASASRTVTMTGSNGGNPAISVAGGGELALGTNAWTLGVANVVAPTAPDRTLTVTISGTTYYIHAKTTND